MRGFESDRKWIIEKKNDVAIRAMDNKEKTDQFIEKNDEIEEGISRIPTDLPEDIQRQVDAAIENDAKVIGLSALMTTTMMKMVDVVELVKAKNLDIKVVIGGAVITDIKR